MSAQLIVNEHIILETAPRPLCPEPLQNSWTLEPEWKMCDHFQLCRNYFMSNFSFTIQNMLIPSCSRSCGTVKFRVPDYLARSRCKEVNFSFPRKTKFVCPRLFYSCRINENNDTTALCFNLLKVNFDGPDLKLTANFSVSESLATYEEINITGNQGRNIANLP
jgi:hypothetical protein